MKEKPSNPLSEDELRNLLLNRLRKNRKTRLDSFASTGEIERISSPLNDSSNNQESTSMAQFPLRLEENQTHKPEVSSQKKKSSSFDRILLVVEGIAVIALLFIVFNGFSLLQNLNQEFASALTQPTLTPTPLIAAVVLPSGHTFSGENDGVPIPNESEIPEHLKPIVQSMAEIPIPTQSPQQAMRIQIDSITIDAPIVQGDGWEQLKKGVGQHIGSINPGESGNLIFSAHNDIYGEIFKNLDQLESGDIIRFFTSQTTYEYTVYQTQIVDPTYVEVLSQTRNPIITLISCYPYGVNNQRIVITGTLKQ
ncbi:MAG: class D sortase [Anaerolineaceae bacterium]|nr:class D sortase [Anaerolineaceae bacterium]